MQPDTLILSPLNAVFFGAMAVFALLFLVLSVLVRRKEEDFRRKFLAALMALTFVGFFVYKYFLSCDGEYSALSAEAGLGAFNWWGELPLHLCNINTFLIPIAVLTKKRWLEGFCFFTAPLGAAMALLMPSVGFAGYSILLPRMLGFYFTHFMVFFGGIALCSFDIFRPAFRDIVPTSLTIVGMLALIFAVNMAMRATGVHPHANYFFSVETEGNPVLELFHSWIPIPGLYMLPCYLVLLPYMLLVTAALRPRNSRRRARRI